jgi:hypothetical protein
MLAPSRYHAGMDRYDWTRLNHLQVGRYAEYFVKMELALLGFDVYTAEVDDKGIDFVIRKGLDRYYDVQVKSLRVVSSGYVFMPKSSFEPRSNLLLALVLLYAGEPPALYLIPATAWLKPDAPLVDRDYPNLKSKPEWGVNVSRRNRSLLERFAFAEVAPQL